MGGSCPIEEWRRSWLYQWTQRATCHSTSAWFFQVGPPSLIASVLKSPIVDSHSALSSASPTVPMDPAMPAWASSAGPYPRILDTGGDYAAGCSVAVAAAVS